MKKKKFYTDGNRLKDLYIKEQNNLMADRLQFVKPTINTKTQEPFNCFKKNKSVRIKESSNLSN